jgi:hypothetical protein
MAIKQTSIAEMPRITLFIASLLLAIKIGNGLPFGKNPPFPGSKYPICLMCAREPIDTRHNAN